MQILLGAALIAVVIFAMRGGPVLILGPLAFVLIYLINSPNEKKSRGNEATLRRQRKFDDRRRMDIESSSSVALRSRQTSDFELSLQTQFRKDLLEYATMNFPYVRNSPDRLPEHLMQAYKSGHPGYLPTFGESRAVFSDYFNMSNIPDLKTSADEFVETVLEDCRSICEKHRHNLSSEKRRLVRKDAYGNVFADEWWSQDKGVHYFVDAVIIPALGQDRWSKALVLSRMSKNNQDFSQNLLRMIDQAADGSGSGCSFSDELSGVQYEEFCGQILTKFGWHVEETAQSGDQGVDLIASKGDTRVCIQCKRYTSSVGNSAVQEVAAGRIYWKGTHAAVVSNASFTSSAKELAESVSVLLLHHDHLENLESLLSNASSANAT